MVMVTMHGVEFLTIGCELWGAGLGGSGRDGGFCVSSVGACVSLCERRRLRPAHGDSGSWRERAIRSKPVETVHKKPKTAARTNRPQRTTTGPLCPRSDAEGGGGTGTNRDPRGTDDRSLVSASCMASCHPTIQITEKARTQLFPLSKFLSEKRTLGECAALAPLAGSILQSASL